MAKAENTELSKNSLKILFSEFQNLIIGGVKISYEFRMLFN